MMEVWVKPEPYDWPNDVKCLICLKENLEFDFNVQNRERGIYEILINQKVEDERIRVVFCSACSKKLIDIDKFRNQCYDSLKSFQEWLPVAKVKVEDDSPTEGATFDTSDEDDKEVIVKKLPRLSYCSVCKKHVASFLAKHVRKVHLEEKNGKLSCKLCDTGNIKDIAKAMRHFQGYHLEFEEPKKCAECGEYFKNPRDYNKHKKLEKYSGKMECHHCGKRCSTRETIKAHIQVKHMGARYCKYCSKTFFDRVAYAEHIVMEEEKRSTLEPKTFLCNICGAVFKKHKQLLVNHHARVHANAFNYSCEVCGKAFISNGLRNQHVKSSHGQLNLYCDTCGKGFGSKTMLSQHKRCVHPKTKEACEICGKSFSPYGMREHRKRHTEDRPYKCPYCTETFKCNTSLRKHLFSHSKTRPYNCLQCETGYYMISYLKSHYQRQHGIIYTNQETLKNCRKEKPQLPEG